MVTSNSRVLITLSMVTVLAILCDLAYAGGLKQNRGKHGEPKPKPTKKPKTYPEDEPNPDLLVRKAHEHCVNQFGRMGLTFNGFGCVFYCDEPGLIGIDQYMEANTPCRQRTGAFGWGTYFGTCQPDFQATIDGNGYTYCVKDETKKKKKKNKNFY